MQTLLPIGELTPPPLWVGYWQAVTFSGGSLWANGGLCCQSPPWPGGGGWEAVYRRRVPADSRWYFAAGANSTGESPDGHPNGAAPGNHDWENYGPAGVICEAGECRSPHTWTSWDDFGTPEQDNRAQTAMLRCPATTSAPCTNVLWLPRSGPGGMTSVHGFTRDGVGTIWAYVGEWTATTTSSYRRAYDWASNALVGAKQSVVYEDGLDHWITQAVSTPSGTWYATEAGTGGDACPRGTTCDHVVIWTSVAEPMLGMDAGRFWRRSGTVQLGRPEGWAAVWDAHFSQDADGVWRNGLLLANGVTTPAYADTAGAWRELVYLFPGKTLPAELVPLVVAVTVPTPGPTVTPTVVPTSTPTPTATPGPTGAVIHWLDWSAPPPPYGVTTISATCGPTRGCSVSVLAAGDWSEHWAGAGQSMRFETIGRRAVGTDTATLTALIPTRAGTNTPAREVVAVPLGPVQ